MLIFTPTDNFCLSPATTAAVASPLSPSPTVTVHCCHRQLPSTHHYHAVTTNTAPTSVTTTATNLLSPLFTARVGEEMFGPQFSSNVNDQNSPCHHCAAMSHTVTTDHFTMYCTTVIAAPAIPRVTTVTITGTVFNFNQLAHQSK